MKIIDVEGIGRGRIRIIRACRDCRTAVSDMGKDPRFCPRCGRKFVNRPEREESEKIARVVEEYYRNKEGDKE